MKWILTDVDGVLTDGRVTINDEGAEAKTICYRDLDSIRVGRACGYDFAFVTGEDTEMVSVLARRFTIERVYKGCKDKLAAIMAIAKELNTTPANLLYIGDSDRDAPAIKAAGLGIAPCDATPKAKAAANAITDAKGGDGVLLEVIDKLIDGELTYPDKVSE